jgi:hypothetical protein
MDMLADAAAWLNSQCEANVSQTVAYARGAVSVQGGIPATIGETTFTSENADGIVETWQSRDFLFTASRLVLGGNVLLPARGDRITETDANGNTFVYQVMSPGNEPHYRFSDPYRQSLRVHTKQVQ